MLIFGIDTCCMAATAALMNEDKLIAQTVVNHNRTHSQKMMPQIEAMFEMAERDVSEVDCFAAAAGPGSFTGVRIGIATAKALAQSFGKPCAAISTLKALANNNALFDGIISPILDARRGQVYNALFGGGRELNRLCDDRAIALTALLDELKQQSMPVLFCGDGVYPFKEEIISALGDTAVFAQRMNNMNLAASVAELGLKAFTGGNTVPYGELVPQYIRLSQAERERLERQKQL